MLFVKDTIKAETLNEVTNFFKQYDSEPEVVTEEVNNTEAPVYKYITTLVTSQYQKSVEDIANTKIGNRRTRKRNLQQVMQESFFAGANRFGNNFIA